MPDHAVVEPVSVRCVRARNLYVPAPEPATNVVLGAVVSAVTDRHVVEPGRCTCTSNTTPVGAVAGAHVSVIGVVTAPLVGDAFIAERTVPVTELWTEQE